MATKKYASVGQMDLAEYGYRLKWEPRGLTVEVIDYHAKPLGIPWELLRELADAAQQSREDSEGP